MANPGLIAAACADLMFTARIRAAAEAAGVKVAFLAGRTDPVQQVRELQPALLLLDLETPWLKAGELIGALKADPVLAVVRVVAFAPHVQAAAIAAARAAGADRVLARSAFVQQLPVLLQSAAGGVGG